MDLDQTPTKTDPDTGEDLRLLFRFTAESNGYVIIQACTRRWYNFLEYHTSELPDIAPRPGVLKRLPPEIRFTIYDLLMPPREHHLDCIELWRKKVVFGFPTIAHVCQEMRQYAMRKYQFLRFTANLRGYGYGSTFGAFDPAQDSITIDLPNCNSLSWVENATVRWKNPFRAPDLAEPFTFRKKEYPMGDRPIHFELGAEREVWQRDRVGDGLELGPRILL
ncbi:hypothetical protein EV127DRAFT_487934 [Xylaria flabelliformis]|nr:hypothetical protein EV127DRAFT_487934 [Xylaria flabelliformis]